MNDDFKHSLDFFLSDSFTAEVCVLHSLVVHYIYSKSENLNILNISRFRERQSSYNVSRFREKRISYNILGFKERQISYNI